MSIEGRKIFSSYKIRCTTKTSPADYMKLAKCFCDCGAQFAVPKDEIQKIRARFGYNAREAKQFTNALVHAELYPDLYERIGVFKIEPKGQYIIISTMAFVKGPMMVQITN